MAGNTNTTSNTVAGSGAAAGAAGEGNTAAGTTLLTGADDTSDAGEGTNAGSNTNTAGEDGGGQDGGAGDAKTKDGEGTEEGGGSEGEPADIEVKLPDGVEADQALLDGFKATAKELGLDSAKAQKMLDLYVKAQTEAVQKADAAFQQEQATWKAQIQADKELGGDRYKSTLAKAKRAIAKYGTPELRGPLEQSGLGNHPELVRLLARIGNDINEDTVSGGTGGTGGAAKGDPWDGVYTKTKF